LYQKTYYYDHSMGTRSTYCTVGALVMERALDKKMGTQKK